MPINNANIEYTSKNNAHIINVYTTESKFTKIMNTITSSFSLISSDKSNAGNILVDKANILIYTCVKIYPQKQITIYT